MRDVDVAAISLERLAGLLDPERAAELGRRAVDARELFAGRVLWNVNSTASGGGVAEMLQGLLAYALGAGVDTRWLVVEGTPGFFAVTKRLHNLLHGQPGDGGDLGAAERATYESVLAPNVEALRTRVRPGDVVLLHDPQTAGMVAPLRRTGAKVVWRSHIGRDTTNELTDRAWAFLRPYIQVADALVFSRKEYVPEWADAERVRIIQPSLDPFSTKNAPLEERQVVATLDHTGLVHLPDHHPQVSFVRRDGSPGQVRRHRGLFAAGAIVPGEARTVLQVSRWDHLKDMGGVLTAFADHLDRIPDDVHLVLVGPDVQGVADDPEGLAVLEECVEQWRSLPHAGRQRVHVVVLPMDDVDENAHIVNALQRYASVVVQKSLVEGFGLTVTEPMWKGRPVIASRVGGIQDQVVDGVSGLLLEDPRDLDSFADLLVSVLRDPALADRLGTSARDRVRDRFLGDRHLIEYVDLLRDLVG